MPADRAGAVPAALENRLDLMNRRGLVVDHWRKIAVGANALFGVLDLKYSGEWLTPDPMNLEGGKPIDFGAGRSRHEIAINTEIPLVRKHERNIYRATLIEYQLARRNFMKLQDEIRLEVRESLRRLDRAAENFIIQRNAVLLACRRVDQSRRLLELPPPPGERRELGPTAARDLLEAQEDLVEAKNSLVETWIDFRSAHLELLRDLEILDLSRPKEMLYGSTGN
jgi:hypothetical protein